LCIYNYMSADRIVLKNSMGGALVSSLPVSMYNYVTTPNLYVHIKRLKESKVVPLLN
jgi:hypothetical protein